MKLVCTHDVCFGGFLRVPEGVEYFLDLLATLHSDDQPGVRMNTPMGTNGKLFNV